MDNNIDLRKKNRKKMEKGSITIFVLAGMFFFLIIVSITFINTKSKVDNQKKQLTEIVENYNNPDNDDDIKQKYDELYEKKYGLLISPTESSQPDPTTKFKTAYGTIDVIWLSGKGNTVSSMPNEPELNNMVPVKWTENAGGWDATPVVTSSSDPDWYNYNAVTTREQSGALTDNTTSHWANAKNPTSGGDSYFVWIPRFAYRITYYSNKTSTEPTGYYDGWGQWRASDANVRLALDNGIETVNYKGKKYIVHPAFCGESVGYDNGSWSEPITGFWASKYEMSRTGATASDEGTGYETTFISVPNVQSANIITIGNMYNVAKSYDVSKESHLMKNSEWGAVAYLAHSQYGRNGNEIAINNSSLCLTGNGGGAPKSHPSDPKNTYNTTTGAKSSTTGNVYGVYDMSGGGEEYVAAFNNTDTNGRLSSYGWSGLSTESSSDKYATKYYNDTTNNAGVVSMYMFGKIGDATKEVNMGGENLLTSTTAFYNWFGDYSYILNKSSPVVYRGGNYSMGFTRATTSGSQTPAGMFFSSSNDGTGAEYRSFRVVLIPIVNAPK